VKIDFKPSGKQHEAFKHLEDKNVTSVLYGGSAGGGKTYLGCSWAIICCLKYSGFRFLIAREQLKMLKESTKITFEETLRDFGLKNYYHYKWNNQDFTCTFENGSVVVFRELANLPSDKEYERLGSNPFSYAFLEEASQLTEKAYEVVKSRLRWVLDDYNLTPKLLLTCNPSKNWLYKEFYKPFKDNVLLPDRRFVQAFVTDNPNKKFVEIYKKNLESIKDEITRERLLFGNWEYANSDTSLCHYDNLVGMFTNTLSNSTNWYLTADISRYGDNDTVIYIWQGLTLKYRYTLNYEKSNKQALVQTAEYIKNLLELYKIPLYNTVIDEDGVGGGVVDMLAGCNGFVANSRARNERFVNLKSECAYLLGDKINNNEITVDIDNTSIQEKIIMEITAYKKIGLDTEKKLSITPKAEVKQLLSGKSPDDGDNFIMRMFLELEKPLNTNNINMITSNSYKGIEKVFDNQFLDYLELERVFAND
jgi:PBSX family phage terminase large subunit